MSTKPIGFPCIAGRADQLWEKEKGTFEDLVLMAEYNTENKSRNHLSSFIDLCTTEWKTFSPLTPPPPLSVSLWLCPSLQEFEVIAQIKLLQLASNNYSFTPDGHFRDWFSSVERLSEAERWLLLG
jgi:hypothetical protein